MILRVSESVESVNGKERDSNGKMAEAPVGNVERMLQQVLEGQRRGGPRPVDEGLPIPEAPVERDPEVDEIIRSIRENKLDDLNVVLRTTQTCPAGVAFANGVSISPFPKLDPVKVSGDSDRLEGEILNWTLRFITAYAHASDRAYSNGRSGRRHGHRVLCPQARKPLKNDRVRHQQ